MSEIDWQGVNVLLNQLRATAKPDELELMETEHTFKAYDRANTRKYNAATDVLNKLYNNYQENQQKLNTTRTEISEMHGLFANQLDKKMTNTTGEWQQVVEDLDHKDYSSVVASNKELNTLLQEQIAMLADSSVTLSNMTFGKDMRTTEGKLKTIYATDLDGNPVVDNNEFLEDGVTKNKHFGKQIKYGWDIDDSGFVSDKELGAGLEATIRFLESEQGGEQNTTGIREGFWSGYVGESDRNKLEQEFEKGEISLADKKLAHLNHKNEPTAFFTEADEEIYKTNYKAMVQGGVDRDFAHFVETHDLGAGDEYLAAQQYSNIAADLNAFKNNTGQLYNHLVSTVGQPGLDKFLNSATADLRFTDEDVKNFNPTEKIIYNAIQGRVGEAEKLSDKLIKNNAKHYIYNLPSYTENPNAPKDFETLASQGLYFVDKTVPNEFSTNPMGESHWVNWDLMLELGFNEEFYKKLTDGSNQWTGNPKQDMYLGFMMKREFEFIYENINDYVEGRLPQHKKSRFDKNLIEFHKRFGKHFTDANEEVMSKIKEYSPEVIETINQ